MFDIKELFSKRMSEKKGIDKIGALKEKIRINEFNLVDFSRDDSDEFIDQKIIESLVEGINCKNSSCHFENEYLEFNSACSAYLKIEQNAELDYKNEIINCGEVKKVLNMLTLGFVDKDDYIIVARPNAYINEDISKWVDGKVYEYELNKFNDYLIDFEDIDENILKKCKLLYLNYPNNPTGKVANNEFYKEVIRYAKKYNFIVINDASYIDLCFDNNDKVSFLSVDGAKEVGVEIYSFSKNFSMGKYKIGFIGGNKEIIRAYKIIREAFGDSSSLEVCRSAIVALNNYEKIITSLKKLYLRRHKLIKEVLEKVGFKVEIPKAGFYQYVCIPKSCNGVPFGGADEFALWLIENLNVSVAPYEERGISVSMNFSEDDEETEKNIARELYKRLSKYKFEF